MPLVAVVMGSKSDTEAIKPTLDILESLGITHEVNVISAHRTPEKAREYALSARERGVLVSSCNCDPDSGESLPKRSDHAGGAAFALPRRCG